MDISLWILCKKAGLERLVGITQANGTDTAFRSAHQQPAQRAVSDRVADSHATSSFAIGRGRHSHPRGGAFVERAAGAVAGVVKRSRYVLTFPQPRLDSRQALGVSVLPRRNAHHALEAALNLVGVRAHPLAECCQSRSSVAFIK